MTARTTTLRWVALANRRRIHLYRRDVSTLDGWVETCCGLRGLADNLARAGYQTCHECLRQAEGSGE